MLRPARSISDCSIVRITGPTTPWWPQSARCLRMNGTGWPSVRKPSNSDKGAITLSLNERSRHEMVSWSRQPSLGFENSIVNNALVVDQRRDSMIRSLRDRFRKADESGDARAKQALFREAIYLGIQPEQFTAA